MQSLGQMLRQARESKNLALEQVERETRIRAKFLLARENGDLSPMPSRVQARGFLYNYAQYLGLNPAEIVGYYDAIHGAQPPTVPTYADPYSAPPQAAPTTPDPYTPPPQTPAPQPGPYGAPAQADGPYVPYRAPTQPSPTPRPGGLPDLATNGAANAAEPSFARRLLSSDLFVISLLALLVVLALAIGGNLLRNLPASETETPSSAFLESLNGTVTVTITPTFAPTSTSTPTPPLLATDRVRVSIEVIQRNWMRIDVDGETVFEGLAEPGVILQYEGLETVRVITGNGAGLVVSYNGVELGPLGERGEVAEQIYTVGGLETLTPTPSPTLTNTPLPTTTGTPGPSLTPTRTPPAESP